MCRDVLRYELLISLLSTYKSMMWYPGPMRLWCPNQSHT